MKKFALWTVGILVGLAFVWYVGIDVYKLLAYGPPIYESEVNDQVKAANYCTATADCVVVSGNCPFVPQLVNVKEKQRMADLYERFAIWNGVCMEMGWDLRDFDRISCKMGKCVMPLKGKVEDKGEKMKDER